MAFKVLSLLIATASSLISSDHVRFLILKWKFLRLLSEVLQSLSLFTF